MYLHLNINIQKIDILLIKLLSFLILFQNYRSFDFYQHNYRIFFLFLLQLIVYINRRTIIWNLIQYSIIISIIFISKQGIISLFHHSILFINILSILFMVMFLINIIIFQFNAKICVKLFICLLINYLILSFILHLIISHWFKVN